MFTVQYCGEECREFEAQECDIVEDLINDITEWRGAPPSELRVLKKGLLLPPELALAEVGGDATLQVVKRHHGGATNSTGKKKRGRKKSSQRAALYRQAQMKTKLTYKERKLILDSRSQPQEEMTFCEF